MMRVTSGFGTKLPSSDLRVVSAARCMAEVTVRGRHGGFLESRGRKFFSTPSSERTMRRNNWGHHDAA